MLKQKVAISRLQKDAEPYIPIAEARGFTALSIIGFRIKSLLI
jgi:hypothetical protein